MIKEVEDKVWVLGRGWIILVEDKDRNIHITDRVYCGSIEFSIRGIEACTHSIDIGLLLSPNDKVNETIQIGDKIAIADTATQERIFEEQQKMIAKLD